MEKTDRDAGARASGFLIPSPERIVYISGAFPADYLILDGEQIIFLEIKIESGDLNENERRLFGAIRNHAVESHIYCTSLGQAKTLGVNHRDHDLKMLSADGQSAPACFCLRPEKIAGKVPSRFVSWKGICCAGPEAEKSFGRFLLPLLAEEDLLILPYAQDSSSSLEIGSTEGSRWDSETAIRNRMKKIHHSGKEFVGMEGANGKMKR